jgi:hypothetical protein
VHDIIGIIVKKLNVFSFVNSLIKKLNVFNRFVNSLIKRCSSYFYDPVRDNVPSNEENKKKHLVLLTIALISVGCIIVVQMKMNKIITPTRDLM